MIEVAQSMNYMDEPSEGNVEILDVDKQAFTQTYDEIDTPAIGPVLVTQHALNQYQARITSGDPKSLGHHLSAAFNTQSYSFNRSMIRSLVTKL